MAVFLNRFIVIDIQFVIVHFCGYAHARASLYARRPEEDLGPRVFRDKVPFVINPDIGRSITRPRKIDRSFTMTHSL